MTGIAVKRKALLGQAGSDAETLKKLRNIEHSFRSAAAGALFGAWLQQINERHSAP
jgi:hypothetical protein